MSVERAIAGYLTIDGSADLKAQISNLSCTFSTATVETTNLASGGMMERKPTLVDLKISFDMTDPEVDESNAAAITEIFRAGAPSPIGSGDGIYTVVVQKISSGGTPGTPTTKDPTYTAAMVVDGDVPLFASDVTSLVNKGQSISMSNATAATYARATA